MPLLRSRKSIVRKNSAGSDFIRRRLNLIEGTNITLTVADDSANNEIDVTIAASGGAGSTKLSGITAADAANTISNGDNAQTWQWRITTADNVAFRYTESAASTASGSPVLFQIDTIAASTAIPLLLKSRGTEVCRVSPTTAQLLLASGSPSSPTLSFFSLTDSGIYTDGSTTCIANAGAKAVAFDAGTLTLFVASPTATTAQIVVAKRSRGSVASPSAITTGDDLLRISADAYVGATGGYVEAARIFFDSTGTITDSTTGVGCVIVFSTRASGSALTEALRITESQTVGFNQSTVGARVHVTETTLGNAVLKYDSVSTNDDPNVTVYQNRVTTTDNTQTTLHTIATASDKRYLIRTEVLWRRTGGAGGANGDGGAAVHHSAVKNVGGTVTFSPSSPIQISSDVDGFGSVTHTISGTNVLVRVTGDFNVNYTWHLVKCEVSELGS
jgi:hypothetical protein